MSQLVRRGAGKADDLASALQNMNLIETQCIYNDDVAVITAAGRRALGQSRVGGLHDDDFAGGYAGLQHPPEFEQRARQNNCLGLALSGTETGPVPFRPLRICVDKPRLMISISSATKSFPAMTEIPPPFDFRSYRD